MAEMDFPQQISPKSARLQRLLTAPKVIHRNRYGGCAARVQ